MELQVSIQEMFQGYHLTDGGSPRDSVAASLPGFIPSCVTACGWECCVFMRCQINVVPSRGHYNASGIFLKTVLPVLSGFD